MFEGPSIFFYFCGIIFNCSLALALVYLYYQKQLIAASRDLLSVFFEYGLVKTIKLKIRYQLKLAGYTGWFS